MTSIKKWLIVLGCIVAAVILVCVGVNVATNAVLNSDPIVGEWAPTQFNAYPSLPLELVSLEVFGDGGAIENIYNKTSGKSYTKMVTWKKIEDDYWGDYYTIDTHVASIRPSGDRMDWVPFDFGPLYLYKIDS